MIIARLLEERNDGIIVDEDPSEEEPSLHPEEECSEGEPTEHSLAMWNGTSLSVLHRFATHGKLILTPYPYIVVREALHPCLYRALDSTFLSDEQLIALSSLEAKEVKQNMRVNVWANTAMQSEQVPDLWKRFVQYHTSQTFYEEVFQILGEQIRTLHKVNWNEEYTHEKIHAW
jgi:hypothetical protein